MRLKEADLAEAITALRATCDSLKEGRSQREGVYIELMLLAAAGCSLKVHKICAEKAGRAREFEEVVNWTMGKWKASEDRMRAQQRKGGP